MCRPRSSRPVKATLLVLNSAKDRAEVGALMFLKRSGNKSKTDDQTGVRSQDLIRVKDT